MEPGDDRAVRPRILVVAYACEPGTGSESGAGWVWPRMLARVADVWVVTRANNRGAIEAALPFAPERDHLRFVYVDLSERLRFWKKGNRGARLYYMIWQGMALREARRIDAEMTIDAVWHLTMSTVWLGSLAPLLRKRFVLGPVGGGVGTPWRLAPTLGVKGTIYDAARGVARFLARYANPLARLAWRRAGLILVQNPDTRDWLPARVRSRVEVFPHIVLDEASMPMDPPVDAPRSRDNGHVAIYAGRLLPWKGVSLAIRALPLLPDWQLLLCGTGPDAGRLRDIASDAGVADRVTFLGWVPRRDLLRLMHERGDVFVFPSLHDEGGWVIAEALGCGLPVVCLDRGGPPVLAGAGVPVSTVRNTVAALASAVEQAATDGPKKPPPLFDDASRRLAELLASRLGLGSMPDEDDLKDEIAHG
jgi:glycosyltransferase involved in cell wall biosynthesis